MLKLTEREPRKVYLERFIIMALLLVPSAFLQGTRAVLVAAVSVLACMITDAICCFIRRRRYDIKDYAVPFWGMAAALMMPVSIPVSLVVLSAVMSVAIGKHLFGDSDNIIFCPPAISIAFLVICYSADMLYFPRYGEKVAAFGQYTGTLSRSIEYSLNIHSVPSQSIGDILMGLVPGPIASVYVAVILVGGFCMALHRSSSGTVTLSCLITAGLLAFFFPRGNYSGVESVIYELSSGYLAFGTVFLAAEPFRTPKKTAGKLLYGIMLGYITMMFRSFGQTECGFVFALLVTCALCGSFDRVVENVIYWKKTYLNTFEKSKTQVQVGTLKLTDTQEIVLPEKYRYNTPPIDNKVTKKKSTRKKEQTPDDDVKLAEISKATRIAGAAAQPSEPKNDPTDAAEESPVSQLKRSRINDPAQEENNDEQE